MTTNNAQGKYADVNGISMYYEIHGSGSPLVLIHGGGSTLYTTFGTLLPTLAQAHTIIGVELQAHGHTADRDTHSSFEQDADDVAELLRQLSISGADIIGFSNGGTTAMQVAIRHPHAVRKLVLCSAMYKRSGMPDWFWDMMLNHGGLDTMPQVYKDEYLRINPGNDKGLLAMYNRDAYRMQTFVDWDDAAISAINAHTLVVVGDEDVVLPEHAVEMYHLLPNARLAILPGNHGSYIGEIMTPDTGSRIPELFVAMVEEFLAAPVPA